MATRSTSAQCATDTKGGYGYDFVSPPPKSLECSICLLTMHDPHVTESAAVGTSSVRCVSTESREMV